MPLQGLVEQEQKRMLEPEPSLPPEKGRCLTIILSSAVSQACSGGLSPAAGAEQVRLALAEGGVSCLGL